MAKRKGDKAERGGREGEDKCADLARRMLAVRRVNKRRDISGVTRVSDGWQCKHWKGNVER